MIKSLPTQKEERILRDAKLAPTVEAKGNEFNQRYE